MAFKPLEKLTVPHYGVFWQSVRAEFSTVQEVAPLGPAISGEERSEQELTFELGALPRIWFISKDQNSVIQLQRDRFLCNWRKYRPSDAYPRYGAVKKMFLSRLSEFSSFLAENELGQPDIFQLELTYVNHVPVFPGKSFAGTASEVFPAHALSKATPSFPVPDRFMWRNIFSLPEQRGRLQVTVNSAIRNKDKHPILTFELSMKGKSRANTSEAYADWFDESHRRIVTSFAALTSEQIQKEVWKRTA